MLENINSPDDVKKLGEGQLLELAEELRSVIIDTVSKNGGHLASNLGMVEASIVLHRLFNAPEDKIIFDVGHQCYAHKLLTGRYKSFYTLRQKDGISGFTRRGESEYDTFTAGHSGPSISASLGIATANMLSGNENYVVCVVGDGSFTNGMIYEALNNCYNDNLKLIILLNDNEMSISSNVGGLAAYLSKIRTSKEYFRFKHRFQKHLSKLPYIGQPLIRASRRIKNDIKHMLLSNDRFFNALGIKYFGPVNGNDIERLETVLEEAKQCGTCCLVHMKTKKGKGYKPAEDNPECYHGVGKFEKEKGVVKNNATCFSERFGHYIAERAQSDKGVCAITAAMCEGTGLSEFGSRFPERFFDVGIAEEHEVAFAAGLAASGMTPVCAVYSTFAQRVYDQVFHDVAIQGLHVVLALDRAGFVPDDGITHQGLFDAAVMSTIPDCTIYSPETYFELEDCFDKSLGGENVCIVRYSKGGETDYDRSLFEVKCGGDYTVYGGNNAHAVIVTYGRSAANAFEAARLLEKKGISVKLIKLVKIYPLDVNIITDEIGEPELLYFLEEGIESGGIAEKLISALSGKVSYKCRTKAVKNRFAPHAKVSELYKMFGMDAEAVCGDICDAILKNDVKKVNK